MMQSDEPRGGRVESKKMVLNIYSILGNANTSWIFSLLSKRRARNSPAAVFRIRSSRFISMDYFNDIIIFPDFGTSIRNFQERITVTELRNYGITNYGDSALNSPRLSETNARPRYRGRAFCVRRRYLTRLRGRYELR